MDLETNKKGQTQILGWKIHVNHWNENVHVDIFLKCDIVFFISIYVLQKYGTVLGNLGKNITIY